MYSDQRCETMSTSKYIFFANLTPGWTSTLSQFKLSDPNLNVFWVKKGLKCEKLKKYVHWILSIGQFFQNNPLFWVENLIYLNSLEPIFFYSSRRLFFK